MAFLDMFRRSARELKSVQCLAITGVLSALYVVLNAYVGIDIPSPVGLLRITFGYLALATIAMLYGPVIAVLAAIPCDLLSATLGPHAMNPIFTPNRMLEGLIYGILLYGAQKINYKGSTANKVLFITRITVARLIAVGLCYFLGNNFLIFYFSLPQARVAEILESGTFWAWAWARNGWKNVIQFPADLALMYVVLPAAGLAYVKTIRRAT
jgi:ECF transporter S component (folate family)